jgi:hypothetical protein
MKYGTTAGVLKALSEITLPDPRIEVEPYRPQGERSLNPADIHERLESFGRLHDKVPERVRTQFEIARNLMLYTYFVFEFQTQAELQAYAALELALRERLGRPTRKVKRGKEIKIVPLMLKELLQKVIAEKLIQSEKLPSFERTNELRKHFAKQREYEFEPMSAKEWLELVQFHITSQRNHLAHGNPHLDLRFSFSQIERCADIINALFPRPGEKANPASG